MGFISKMLSPLLLGVAAAVAPYAAKAQQNAQPEIKVTANYGRADRSVYLGYWEGNPRFRLGYTNGSSFSVGAYLPISRNNFKIVAAREGQRKELGLYYQTNLNNNILLGAGVEDVGGQRAAEIHGRFDIGNRNKIFASYGNIAGTSTATIGDFLDAGNYHFGLVGSLRSDNSNTAFGGRRQILGYFSRNSIAKLFYRDDGDYRSLTGFVRFGENESRRYTPRAFDNDRVNFAEFTLRHARAELFDIPLQSSNTHLSDHGTCVAAPKIIFTPQTNTQSIDAYCTLNRRWIIGYGFSRAENDSGINRANTISSGINAGPIKFVLSWNRPKGFSAHASLIRR